MISEKNRTSAATSIDIVQIISKYVDLHKAGKDYRGQCPFHGANTFYVSPQKRVFKCFGCGISGNAIHFIVWIERVSFSEAICRATDICRQADYTKQGTQIISSVQQTIKNIQTLYDLNTLSGRNLAIEECLPVLRRTTDTTEQDQLIATFALEIGIKESRLRRLLSIREPIPGLEVKKKRLIKHDRKVDNDERLTD